ncbi:MAG: cob(I)yrinic acid a,c-diamide adenosyltransferase [Acidimicrobiales bacterium]
MKIYTKAGDDGTTGLLYGGRVRKDSELPVAYGSVDEAQAALGVARAHAEPGGELDEILVGVERDLYVLMAEVATASENRHKLTDGTTRVTAAMVEALEHRIDTVTARFEMPTEFVIPGGSVAASFLDVARTVVRRAERVTMPVVDPDSQVLPYLNRLSDLAWALARWQEGESLASKSAPASDHHPRL